MENSASIEELISLAQASLISGISIAHLRRLVDNGQLWGVKIGRNWVTTKKSIEEYKSLDHPRGRKPKKS